MQRYARTTNFLYQRFTAALKLVQIGRTERFVSGFGKDQISYLQIAYWTIVRRRKWVDLFCNAQRSFSNLIVRANVADNSRINRVTENHKRVVSRFDRNAPMHE